ncbi:MAG: MazG nucleotide pyrophosphohydrolase domain, partial [Solirubrobacteraceae bacterium]|nr:MazG nucleotide pyrophosphohydrolase domain [Solirubrobacteraceae bacterium]
VAELAGAQGFDEVGELLFAAVALARGQGVDPELALRSAADRFRSRIEQEESRASE